MAMELDAVNLSLDEIIARQKRPVKKFGGGGGRANTRFARGGIRGAPRQQQRVRGGGVFKTSNRSPQVKRYWTQRMDEKPVVVNVSNLAPFVSTADLEELFAAYPFEGCTVQYNEMGQSMGTAVVVFRRFDDAMALKRAFSGIKLDGRKLDLYVVSNEPRPRTSFSSPSQFRGNFAKGFSTPRGGGNRFGRVSAKGNAGSSGGRANMGGFVAPARGGGGRGRKPTNPRNTMTADDLDRELDAYMRSGRHVRVIAP